MTRAKAPAPGAGADDVFLVGRARSGDGEAFRVLYERHAPAILALLRRTLGDAGRPEDALADVFVKAHAGLASFDVGRSFGAWLAGVARHVALDQLRARASHSKEVAERESSEPAPLDRLVLQESESVALDLLARLGERARQVVLLRYRRGLTQSETASELGTSRRLVATIQKEALAELARLVRARRAGEEVP